MKTTKLARQLYNRINHAISGKSFTMDREELKFNLLKITKLDLSFTGDRFFIDITIENQHDVMSKENRQKIRQQLKNAIVTNKLNERESRVLFDIFVKEQQDRLKVCKYSVFQIAQGSGSSVNYTKCIIQKLKKLGLVYGKSKEYQTFISKQYWDEHYDVIRDYSDDALIIDESDFPNYEAFWFGGKYDANDGWRDNYWSEFWSDKGRTQSDIEEDLEEEEELDKSFDKYFFGLTQK